MNILIPEDDSVARWVAARVGDVSPDVAPDRSVGIVKDGRLIAGVVYYGHEPKYKSAQATFAGEAGWASRRTVAAILWPAFMELECQRITALIRKKNKPSRTMVEKMGFRLEGSLWRGFGDDHMCVYGLRRSDAEAKWLERYNGSISQ